jgi:hypothetical protein
VIGVKENERRWSNFFKKKINGDGSGAACIWRLKFIEDGINKRGKMAKSCYRANILSLIHKPHTGIVKVAAF